MNVANNAALAKIELQYQQSRKCQRLRGMPSARPTTPLNELNEVSKGGKDEPQPESVESAPTDGDES